MPKTVATRARVLVNPSSGFDGNDETPGKLRELFSEAGWDAKIHLLEPGEDLSKLAADAVRQGSEIVVAGGGDGTIRAVASAVSGTACALGVLPLGTLNHFARDLGIPIDLEGAAGALTKGKQRRVDIGEVNGRLFLNNAILGLYPWYRAIRETQENRGRTKPLAILTAIARVLRVNPVMKVAISTRDCKLTRVTPYILVANNRHAMEGYHLGTRASLNEGKLFVYLMQRQTRLGLVRLVIKLLLGRFRTTTDFEVFEADEVTVETRRASVDVSLDGEIVTLTAPLVFRSRPGELSVIAPAEG